MSESRTVDVLDASGSKAGTAELPGDLFDVTANVPLIHQVVVAQLAAARQGTHATKTRGDVRGGGKKPYRQKGTGRARQGSIRSPQYAGGGIAHGPQPRNYAQRTPKKMIVAALRGALSDRARDGRVHVLADLVIGDSPSTKAALAALAAIGSSTKKLVVLHRDDDLAWLSLRNVAEIHALEVGQLNAYDVLCNDDIVFTTAALQAYVAGPAKGKSGKAVATESEVEIDEPTNAELEAAAGESKFGAGSFVGEEPPSGFDVKGNEDSMKFHTPDSPWYARTVAEVWFDSAEAAEAAGFVNAVTADETEEDDK